MYKVWSSSLSRLVQVIRLQDKVKLKAQLCILQSLYTFGSSQWIIVLKTRGNGGIVQGQQRVGDEAEGQGTRYKSGSWPMAEFSW